jgi:5-formyltetrahydrofolate cyclo-ligase
VSQPIAAEPGAAKRELRARMRRLRSDIVDVHDRSRRLWAAVEELDEVRSARVVMLFTSIATEPQTAAFVEWCEAAGKQVLLPEDDPDPQHVDVVLVPGLAFTADGHRLGQGGGWYDRFLARVGPHCSTIGVGFAVQLVDTMPIEAHDVVLDRVVTEFGAIQSSS